MHVKIEPSVYLIYGVQKLTQAFRVRAYKKLLLKP